MIRQTALLLLWALGLPTAAAAQDLLAQAKALESRGQIDSAYVIIQRAVAAEPNRAEVQFWLGSIAGQRAERIGGIGAYASARKSKAGFGRAVQLEPTNPDYLEGLIQYLSQAPGIVGGDRDSALVLAEAVRRINEPRGTLLMVNVLNRGNRREKARADSIMDTWARTHEERIEQVRVAAYYSQSDRPERALGIHERLFARDHADLLAQFGIARNLVVLKRDPRRALGILTMLSTATAPVSPAPTYQPAAVWWRMGQAYLLLGKPDSARSSYEQALRVAPTFRQAQASLDSLRH